MPQYFKDLDALHQFTMELDRHQDSLRCKHCTKCGQFVSHGYVYKKQYNSGLRPIGKRVFCSNRFGKSGCGRTLRLYVAARIPGLQYAATHLSIFLSALIAGLSIQKAYHKATATAEPRNALRWLHKLDKKLLTYRRFLKWRPVARQGWFASRTRRLQLLLPTLQALFSMLGHPPCANYQLTRQTAFI